MSKESFQHYVTRAEWMQGWGDLPAQPEEWPAAVSWTMRGHALFVNLWYGVLANPITWAEALAYATLMTTLGYTFGQHLFLFVMATVVSYALAPHLPLKRFTGVAYEVGVANGWRLFIPFLVVGLSFGRLALGSSLVALVAAGLAAAASFALFHWEGGYLLKDRKFLTSVLERRLAVTGLSLPVNWAVVERFVAAGKAMDVDVEGKARPGKTE
jgi:hypothetical protein